MKEQYLTGDHFTVQDLRGTYEIAVTQVSSRFVFYRVMQGERPLLSTDRTHFDNLLNLGVIRDGRPETVKERAMRLIDAFCEEEYGSTADFSNLRQIGIGFTTITDEELPVQIFLNLQDYSLERLLGYEDKVFTDKRQYDSLDELLKEEIENLCFEDLISFSDDEIAQASEKALSLDDRISDASDRSGTGSSTSHNRSTPARE